MFRMKPALGLFVVLLLANLCAGHAGLSPINYFELDVNIFKVCEKVFRETWEWITLDSLYQTLKKPWIF